MSNHLIPVPLFEPTRGATTTRMRDFAPAKRFFRTGKPFACLGTQMAARYAGLGATIYHETTRN
jgi:hypothetical protein